MDKLETSTPVVPASRHAVARARLASAQKSKASVPAYLRYVNRPIGGRLAALAYAADLTPTQVTVLSAVCSFAGIAVLLLAAPTVPVGIAVAALLLVGYALDSADGQLARIRGGGSKAGEWLDHVVDMAKLSSLHSVVAISVLRFFDVPRLNLAIPLVFGVANATQFLGMMLRDKLRGPAGRPAAEDASALRSWLLLPLDHGTLGLAFVLLGWHIAFLAGYGLLALCTVAFAARSLSKAYRGLVALDRLGSPG